MTKDRCGRPSGERSPRPAVSKPAPPPRDPLADPDHTLDRTGEGSTSMMRVRRKSGLETKARGRAHEGSRSRHPPLLLLQPRQKLAQNGLDDCAGAPGGLARPRQAERDRASPTPRPLDSRRVRALTSTSLCCVQTMDPPGPFASGYARPLMDLVRDAQPDERQMFRYTG